MGKGDKKSRKGKIFRGSYGNSRPRKSNKVNAAQAKQAKVAKPTPTKKETAK